MDGVSHPLISQYCDFVNSAAQSNRQRDGDNSRRDENDGAGITLAQKTPDQVCVTLPWLYVNCVESDAHEKIDNLYLIDFEKLKEIVATFASAIESGTSKQQTELCPKLISLLDFNSQTDEFNVSVDERQRAGYASAGISNVHESETYSQVILDYLMSVNNMQQQFDVDDEFVNVGCESISLDPVRVYVNDPETGLLVSCTEQTVDGVSFYSQLGANDAEKIRLRQYTNETDLNQIYFILNRLTDSLLFKQNRLCCNYAKLINICLLYMLLLRYAIPVRGNHINYNRLNLLAFIVDCFIRGRILSHWQLGSCTKQLLTDLITNYAKENPMVGMCRLDNPRDRAQYILHTMQTTTDTSTANIVKCLSYDEYDKILEESKWLNQTTGKQYYNLDHTFISKFVQMHGFNMLLQQSNIASKTKIF